MFPPYQFLQFPPVLLDVGCFYACQTKTPAKKTAAEGVQLVGGTENISSVAHCMIRLRFAVKDLNKADQEALKKIPGVLSVTPAA